MATQIIMRPVYNRPEMLYLSIEAEIEARNYYKFPDDLLTLFIVECGADSTTMNLVKHYPFRNYCILRNKKHGLSVNILEGFKEAFDLTEDYVIYIEDDVLIHKTYFEYMNTLLNMDLGKVSVLSAYNFDDDGDVHEVRRKNHYAALAPIIMKDFYSRYILPCSYDFFYKSPAEFAIALNKRYKEHWATKRYRYRDSTHHAQAGIINRLTDVAEIEEDMWCIMPAVNRQQHIGFWGANRQKNKDIPGIEFDKRVDNLREIVKNADKMYDMAGSKEYDDYKIFSSKLENWDKTLKLLQ